LADRRVVSGEHLEAVFATFDAVRRPRGNWLVQSSRRIGDCYEWRAEGVGQDFKAIEGEINSRNGTIADVDCKEMCYQARRQLGERLSDSSL
jgi:salicylate hydroxylase